MTKKFYEKTPTERLNELSLTAKLRQDFTVDQNLVNAAIVENYISDFREPEGVLRRLQLDGHFYTVPMAIEEPSVIAAANNGARMLNFNGGIFTEKIQPAALTLGQLLFEDVNVAALHKFIDQFAAEIQRVADLAKPSIVKRGGGLVKVQLRELSLKQVSVDFLIDTKEAMGANIVNTILAAEKEFFQPFIQHCLGAILSNDGRNNLTKVFGRVPFAVLGGEAVANKIVALSRFSKVDSYRAVTENKGIFNGVGAVVLATGNDWRAVEAAGHAYASQQGTYQSLSHWSIDANQQQLVGELVLPLPIGSIGGAITALPQAQRNLALLEKPSVQTLREIIAGVGLAQNLAALKAIAGEGIQTGHMRMQYRALALQVGAQPHEVLPLARRLSTQKTVDTQLASQILKEIRRHES
ncbi:hydroxymethylglutaryl-CoA reductase, degradative [Convivina praedatoris]|uniref:3-hydroxy-3-methylglutaryl coenzyme A reductase n=1 Tax=Convivina praedatoris TaxID=2880963 RepID=A0ABN8H852_9LACO|nr:hydroxymethylglutaryl-CoA reductase, degradative [Convivina sp. LMG 32447]CAH1852216.1 3-hydroxy-3-methylglutaryl-coenzyme A reductase [Convivina sp. LMG 32447]CAH1852250.1 3-hydroxy-3-methylglutaryl-coenzyme A reductase [Convivina sp. LMG 32447]CAH1852701.1 3-hydroxy-3-methylglutaryl-coenzyme A reductase [Convivina sp. LMG 32447]